MPRTARNSVGSTRSRIQTHSSWISRPELQKQLTDKYENNPQRLAPWLTHRLTLWRPRTCTDLKTPNAFSKFWQVVVTPQVQSDSNPTDNLRKRDGSICCAAGIELRRRTAGSRQTLSIAPHCVFHVQHHVLALKKKSGPGASTSAITRFLQWSRTAFTALSRLMALAVPPLDRRCSFQFWLSGWPGTGSSLEGFGSEGVSETLLLGRLLSTLDLQTRERVASLAPCSLFWAHVVSRTCWSKCFESNVVEPICNGGHGSSGCCGCHSVSLCR